MTNDNHRLDGAEPAQQPDDAGDIEETIPEKDATTRHTLNESADKIQVTTKVKRGSDTRDQDEIKVHVKGDEPREVVTKLNETVARLQGTGQNLRDFDPERQD